MVALNDWFKFAKWGKPKGSASRPKPFSASDMKVVAIPMIDGDPVLSIRSEELKNILDSAADDGETQQQALLIETMQERDPRLGGLISTRRDAIMGCDYRLIPRDETGTEKKGETPEVTKAMRMLESANLHGLLEHLCFAIDVGYSGSLTEWLPGGDGIAKFHPVHPTAWIFDKQGNPALRDRDDNEKPLFSRNPFSYVFHTNAPAGTICAKSGLGRKLAWLWYFKHTDMRYWVRYAEKFGIPFMLAKISKADYDDPARKAKLLSDLRKIGSDGAILTVADGGVEPVGVSGTDNSIHERLVSYIDRSYAISILGQLGSSEGQKGQIGNNEAMDNVREDIKEKDCKRLMPVIQQKVIDPYWRFKHGEKSISPRFVMDYARTKQVKYWAEVFTTMDQRLWRPSDEDVSSKMGMSFVSYEAPEPAAGKESTPLVTKKAKVTEKAGGTNASKP